MRELKQLQEENARLKNLVAELSLDKAILRKMQVHRRQRYVPKRPNLAWSMDFVSDQLVNGHRYRALTIVDEFTREALAIRVGQRLRAEDVVATCTRLVAARGAPKRVFVDNGSEFSGRVMDLWAYHNRVHLDFSRPGKPTENCFIRASMDRSATSASTSTGSNALNEAQRVIEAWRIDYNVTRPHQSLKDLTPVEFAANYNVDDNGDVDIAAGD